MNQDKFDILIRKYQNDELIGAEKELLDHWFDSLDAGAGNRWTAKEVESLKQKIIAQIDAQDQSSSSRTVSIKRWLPYAAAILLLATFGSLYYLYYDVRTNDTPTISNSQTTAGQEDVAPGSNKATLTLSDGTTMALNEDYSGIVTGEKGITYEGGNTLLHKGNETLKAEVRYATLSVPRGGQYQVVLEDGSKVWLNSGTSLKYPLRFENAERSVELDGEAYFEIAARQNLQGKRLPFKVTTSKQTVEVLGTKFNVSAYADEKDTKTTLVSGKVRVARPHSDQTAMLRPGDESIVRTSSADIQVHPVNVDLAIARKSGIFYFEDTPLSQMLQQVARWYDIDVVYEGTALGELFSGKMSRNVTLSVLVKFLKDSGVNVRVEGKKLIVKK